jgi:hypothetical protein
MQDVDYKFISYLNALVIAKGGCPDMRAYQKQQLVAVAVLR